jgi:hypothetical protein
MNEAIAPLLERLRLALLDPLDAARSNAWAVCRCGRNAGPAPAIPLADIT